MYAHVPDINEFTLSTAFDVSTASFVDKSSVSSQDGNPFSMAFNSDGTKMFMLGYNNDRVNEYSLTSPYNLINVSAESRLIFFNSYILVINSTSNK